MMRYAWITTVMLALVTVAAEEQVPTAPAQDTAQQAAVESIRVQNAVEAEIMEAIALLGTPGWERAQATLIRIGSPAVPYLIEAMAGQSAGAFPAEGYPLSGPGRATRTVALKDTAFAVLVNLFQNHSNYNGALPGKDAAAWREFWTHVGQNVAFGTQEVR